MLTPANTTVSRLNREYQPISAQPALFRASEQAVKTHDFIIGKCCHNAAVWFGILLQHSVALKVTHVKQ